MTTDTTPLVKALLWAGIEDFCPLWQAVWEINAILPDKPAEERLALTRSLVSALLEEGAIELVWQDGESIEPIDPPAARLLPLQDKHWEVRQVNERQVCLSTTDAGQDRYLSLSRER